MKQDPYWQWVESRWFWPVAAAVVGSFAGWHALEEPGGPFLRFTHDYLNLPVLAAFALALAWNRSQALDMRQIKTKLAKMYNHDPELHREDSEAWFACFFLSENTAADQACLRWYYVESMAYLLLAQRYVAPVHAACVAKNGAGILLCGESGSGKSTLSFACGRAGWTFISDDCTWLRTDSEDRMALGKPHQARFRDNAPSVFPELSGYAASARPSGKLSLEVPLSDFPQIRTALRCPIGALVFLDRRIGAQPRAARLLPGEGADQLLQDMPTYGSEVDAMHERAIRRLEDLPAWRLHYESLDDALRLLSEVMLSEIKLAEAVEP
jgi:hypothetical protein